MLLPVTSSSLCNIMSKNHHGLLLTGTSLQVGVVTLRILAPLSGRAALISVARFGIIGWRIGEVTEVCSRTEKLSDSSLMESLFSGIKRT